MQEGSTVAAVVAAMPPPTPLPLTGDRHPDDDDGDSRRINGWRPGHNPTVAITAATSVPFDAALGDPTPPPISSPPARRRRHIWDTPWSSAATTASSAQPLPIAAATIAPSPPPPLRPAAKLDPEPLPSAQAPKSSPPPHPRHDGDSEHAIPAPTPHVGLRHASDAVHGLQQTESTHIALLHALAPLHSPSAAAAPIVEHDRLPSPNSAFGEPAASANNPHHQHRHNRNAHDHPGQPPLLPAFRLPLAAPAEMACTPSQLKSAPPATPPSKLPLIPSSIIVQEPEQSPPGPHSPPLRLPTRSFRLSVGSVPPAAVPAAGRPRSPLPSRGVSLGSSAVFGASLTLDDGSQDPSLNTHFTMPRSSHHHPRASPTASLHRFRSRESLNGGLPRDRFSASTLAVPGQYHFHHHHQHLQQLSGSPVLNALHLDRPHSPAAPHGTDLPFAVRLMDSMGLRSVSPSASLSETDNTNPRAATPAPSASSPTRSEFMFSLRGWDPARYANLRSRSWASIFDSRDLLASPSMHDSDSTFLSFPADYSPLLLPVAAEAADTLHAPSASSRRPSFLLDRQTSHSDHPLGVPPAPPSPPHLPAEHSAQPKSPPSLAMAAETVADPTAFHRQAAQLAYHKPSGVHSPPAKATPPPWSPRPGAEPLSPAAREFSSPAAAIAVASAEPGGPLDAAGAAEADEDGGGLVGGRYRVQRTVGVGSFAKVKLAIDTVSGARVAVKMTARKMIAASSRLRAGVESEIQIMKSLNHPGIVAFLDRVDLRDHLCVVLEYVGGGELFDYIAEHKEKIPLNVVSRLFRELAEAVYYLHTNLICHRDIKIENILLTTDEPVRVKLTDFGFACRLIPEDSTAPRVDSDCDGDEDEDVPHGASVAAPGEVPVRLLTARCGSEEYAAPEVVLQRPYDGRRTDAWACGVVLFAMLAGQLPFTLEPGARPRAFYKRIAMAEFAFPPDPRDSSEDEEERHRLARARDLVRAVLVRDPAKRCSVADMLRHPYLAPS
ncbi:hypothetical protein HK405_007883 [Cladochytrium tenue]|nr:hypothetical protein HK405_007883 [Cladochytrium tenue]